ncbi:MAG: PIN domain-containing protein [Bacillota bacterium]
MATNVFKKLFVDAGAWIAIANKKDRQHQAARVFYYTLPQFVELYTSYLVISEAFTWQRYHLGSHVAFKFIDSIEKASISQLLKIIFPDALIDAKTRQYLHRYKDHNLSYSDAASFAICDMLKINDIFGFDKDFYIVKKSLWPPTT